MRVEYGRTAVWPVRHAVAVLRGLVLVGVALAGLVMAAANLVAAVLLAVGLFPLHLAAVRGAQRLANLARRLARDWGGVVIAEPYRGEPPAPVRRGDGWYEYDNRLYKSPRYPRFMGRYRWITEDPATARDWLWMLSNAAAGGVLALLPAAAIAYGVFVVASAAGFPPGGSIAPYTVPVPVLGSAWAVAVVGPLIAVAGFAAAPATLRLHARWTAVLLVPSRSTCGFGDTRAGRFLIERGKAIGYAQALAGLSLLAFLVFLAQVGTLVLSFGSLFPAVVESTRSLLNDVRRYVGTWTGTGIPEPYLPEPPPPEPDANGMYRYGRQLHSSPRPVIAWQRNRRIHADPATWRDLLWMLLGPVAGLVGALVPAAAAIFTFFGMTWPWVWMTPIAPFTGYLEGPLWGWHLLTDVVLALDLPGAGLWLGFPLGIITMVTVIATAPYQLRFQTSLASRLLSPTERAGRDRLARRVQELVKTRADATDAEAAELRRIERDLHDGAQARLVSMGMKLGAIEQLVDSDPEAAKNLLAQVRAGSSEALTELRDLIRGIHPPVLAERGLGDAVRALALDSSLSVQVTADLPDRLDAPVESAAYFAASELLTNAARHADASNASVGLHHRDGNLRVTITDDGHGGADPSRGTGLRGIERRLGTFDGVLTLGSPPGGPTTATIDIPCTRWSTLNG